MASLLDEIRIIKKKGTKVVADGGISGYSDAIKCLALGADYVMMGKVFTKAAIHGERIGSQVSYYGMSTKTAQKEMGCLKLKTSEGKFDVLTKEYTLEGWAENFTDYLRSAMSYTGARDLGTFRTQTTCQVISPNSSYAINNK
jgi:isopentenyl diphosphate isomerase/L-lactate dehydrogenase-like FMN-dependent dehydrogenase